MESGITNGRNAWFPDEAAVIASVQRIVHLSIETARIVDSLPEVFPDRMGQHGGGCG